MEVRRQTHDPSNTQHLRHHFHSAWGKLSNSTLNASDLLLFFSPRLPQTAHLPQRRHVSEFKAKQSKLLKQKLLKPEKVLAVFSAAVVTDALWEGSEKRQHISICVCL